ncbi:DUF222 domain-containing protein [Cumulibacter manganitolerans]|uniref:DUF222 domain-containing protein n=1 Tax=Cumulibacter manganitolerans TaxID=1884992 RepID=UPI001297893C|nr:DUF222 domain-containing protein [Cumulibacter manganitolerans]
MTAIGWVSTAGDDEHREGARAAAAPSPAQRVVGGVIARALDLADTLDAGSGAGYAAAIAGLDVLESLASAVEAAKARLIVEAHAHAHQMLARDDVAPGQRRTHPDGTTESVLSRTQITAIDVATTLKVTTGCATAKVEDALRLVRHLPGVLARLEDGTLTGYQATYRIARACTDLNPDQLATVDEQLCERSFTPGTATGPGAHRARTANLGRWLDAARAAAGAPTDTTRTRRCGFAGRRLDFGPTGPDGMSALFASMPAAYATALDRLLTDLAREHARPGDPRTEPQRKLDAFLTLFTGPIALFSNHNDDPDRPPVTSVEWDEDGQYVLIEDEDQYTEARAAWDAIKTLAASLDLTLPDLPPATITLDVPLDALTDPDARTGPEPPGEPPDARP